MEEIKLCKILGFYFVIKLNKLIIKVDTHKFGLFHSFCLHAIFDIRIHITQF